MCNVNLVDVPTIGMPLALYLTYNAQDTVYGDVGHKWRHNFMMRLNFTGSPVTYVVLVSQTGRHYGFTKPGSDWVLDTASGYGFFIGVLSHPSSDWHMTFPDGSYNVFDSSGNFIQSVDPHGNQTTLAYSSGLLAAVTEPTGRQLIFAYNASDLLETVTDPRGNSTTLTYDGDDNLTVIAGPTGCTTTYGYASPSDHLLTSRTDALTNEYTFSYDGSSRLYQVTDAESHTLTYAYDTVDELVGTTPTTYQTYNRTTLTDARGKTWEYRFDLAGNLRRAIDPLLKSRFLFWDQIIPGQGISQQRLLYESAGFPYNEAPTPQLSAPNWRSTYDSTNNNGNELYNTDANGLITQFTYDSARNLTSRYPGQAHLGVQGNWVGEFGNDGWVLCSFVNDASDRQTLPPYVSSLGLTSLSRIHLADSGSGTVNRLIDPRTPVDATSLQRGVGFWQFSGSSPQISVNLTESKSFNLSFYTSANNQDYESDTPLAYSEQFGYDLTITVTDLNGTQSFRIYDNAPGVWVTFPVAGDATHPVHVTVVPSGTGTVARISAMMFDPYDSKRTDYTYNASSDLTSITDALGNQTVMSYNTDGTMETSTDANSHETQYFYEDDNKNLTRVVDPTGAVTTMAYDENGNLLSLIDPNLRVRLFTYDEKDRLLTATDPLGNVTSNDYDAAGNLIEVTDANGNSTTLTYTPANRVATIVDPLGNTVAFSYDEAGNTISVTDANGNLTQFAFDDNGRLSVTTLADGNTITYAYDGLNRLRATTTPNGTQPSPGDINLVNAFNWVQNPGMEQIDPHDDTLPRSWVADPMDPDNIRDSGVSHSGDASVKLALSSGTQYWSQANLGMPAGVSAMLQFWGRPDGGTSSEIWSEASMYNASGTAVPSASGHTTLPSSSTSWMQTPWFSFAVPPDGDYLLYPVAELRLYGQSSGTTDAWFDDVALVSLSMARAYDRQGRLTSSAAPDGATVQYRYDRFGRLTTLVDPRGNTIERSFDSVGRLTSVTDPLGNVTSLEYDPVGNLSTMTDPLGNITEYAYDNVNRLTTMTYPDASTESWAYDGAGNLILYTNNRGQETLFIYDAASRLIVARYETDLSTVTYTWDPVGNLINRIERNGDYLQFTYDAANRPIGNERIPAAGESIWVQANTFDGVGNRTAFSSGATTPVFDVAAYDEADYAVAESMWSVPSPGFDTRNRMPAYIDALNQKTTFGYDVENRMTAVNHAEAAVVSALSYDVVGKLMAVDTSSGMTDLLPLAYGYDLASNRVGLVAGDDTFDYEVDSANRLVSEEINRFVEQSFARFSQGSLETCVTSPVSGAISLLEFSDAFNSTAINADRWRMAYADGEYVGLEVRPLGNSLQMCFPRGFWNKHTFGPSPGPLDYGLRGDLVWAAVEHRLQLSGDFDIAVDFSTFQGIDGFGTLSAALYVSPTPIEQTSAAGSTYAYIARDNTPRYQAFVQVSGTGEVDSSSGSVTDTEGRLRIARASSTITLYYWASGSWTSLGTYASYDTADTYVSLYFSADSSVGTVGYQDFGLTDGSTMYAGSGLYTSTVYDAGRSVSWDSISWSASVPSAATLEFQVAVSSSVDGPWSFVGPDGTSGTYFTTFPYSIPSLTGQYCRYQATLGGDGTVTPTLRKVHLSYGGTATSQVTTFAYDAGGNLVSKKTMTDSGATALEIRDSASWAAGDRINDLNQILRNDIYPSLPLYNTGLYDTDAYSVPTTWRYAYDLSGNLTSKTPWLPITGDISNGNNTVTSVSPGDIAKVTVGAGIQSSRFPAGTTVSTVISTSFTVSQNATATVTAASLWVQSDADATVYTWDEDNRLLQVDLPGGTSIEYTYDVEGRMLSRTNSAGTTTFEWDGFDCVRESAPPTGSAVYDTATYDSSDDFGSGGVTQYYVVNGQLRALVRDNALFAVTSDAQGSVRLVVDGSGTVVSKFDYEAWGNLLASSFDALPGSMVYRYVGALGCRWDADTGLTYMRQRWYDGAGTQRFLSRDPVPLTNEYSYSWNSPTSFVDPSGMISTDARTDVDPGPPKPSVPDAPGWLPPEGACQRSFGACFAQCIEDNDPLNLLAKGLLTGMGGPVPKALVSLMGVRTTRFMGASNVTTLPSIAAQRLGMGTGNWLRQVGRASFWAWLAYGNYMAYVEARCATICAGFVGGNR